jgi:PurA ssDNA and RNA-binding protein
MSRVYGPIMTNQSGDFQPPTPSSATEEVVFEREIFFIDLKENDRGRFFKITEDVGRKRNTIMLPSGAFRDFLDALQRLVEFEQEL